MVQTFLPFKGRKQRQSFLIIFNNYLPWYPIQDILLNVLNGGRVRQTLSLWIEIRVHPELEIRG